MPDILALLLCLQSCLPLTTIRQLSRIALAQVLWLFFRHHLFQHDDVYLLAGDEVVVTKAGKHTYGLDRFFSSVYGKPIPGIAFFAFSLVSVQARRAFPV